MGYRSSRVFAVLILTGALSATLAACGSGGSSTASSTASSSTTPTTTAGGAPTSGTPATATAGTATAGTHPTEFNPPGDIPDNTVYVDHVAPGSRVHFTVPEGWAQASQGGATAFTDHYNGIAIQVVAAVAPPSAASVKQADVPKLKASAPTFQLTGVDTVSRKGAGTAVRIRYLVDSKPDPVTGKVVRDAVERYEFWHQGHEAILTLTGPQNADNVDPWRTVSDSVTWK